MCRYNIYDNNSINEGKEIELYENEVPIFYLN